MKAELALLDGDGSELKRRRLWRRTGYERKPAPVAWRWQSGSCFDGTPVEWTGLEPDTVVSSAQLLLKNDDPFIRKKIPMPFDDGLVRITSRQDVIRFTPSVRVWF